MATWLRRAVLPARLPGVEAPELQNLQEAKIMLAERAATWPRQWMAEGFEKGHEKGLTKGHAQGLESGLRDTLTDLIEVKFGAVDARDQKRVAEASEEQLRSWLRRILTAATAADLFRN